MRKKAQYYPPLGHLRLPIFVGLMVFFLALGKLRDLMGKNKLADHLWIRMNLFKTLLPLLGVKTTWKNLDRITQLSQSEQACLFISNHRSYLDPLALMVKIPFLPVSKMEVSKWPILGWGMKYTGCIYVKRENKDSRRNTRSSIVDYIKKGESIFIFPEGTSHKEPQTIPFHVGIFHTAAQHNLLIVPIAVDYPVLNDAWVGDDGFFRHFFECFSKLNTHQTVSIGPVFRSENAEELINESRAWIDEELTNIQETFDR